MITEETVLILGAGASCDFGYPLGYQLRETILKLCEFHPNTPNDRANALVSGPLNEAENISKHFGNVKLRFLVHNCGFAYKEIEQFYIDFLNAPKISIDTFLENRQEFLGLGKQLIAIAIKMKESEHHLILDPVGRGQNWYKRLFNIMDDSWETFENNKLSVVTYNYDRSLEYFLARSLNSTYGKPLDECIKKVSKIPIVHVHGKLCEDTIPYSPSFTVKDIKDAAKRLNIIVEGADENVYARIREMIIKSKHRFILGFGYDRRNLKNLKIADYNNLFYSTRTGLSDLDINSIFQHTNGKIIFSAREEFTIVDFLKYEASLSGLTMKYGTRNGVFQFNS